jgi:hypothetical protein
MVRLEGQEPGQLRLEVNQLGAGPTDESPRAVREGNSRTATSAAGSKVRTGLDKAVEPVASPTLLTG